MRSRRICRVVIPVVAFWLLLVIADFNSIGQRGVCQTGAAQAPPLPGAVVQKSTTAAAIVLPQRLVAGQGATLAVLNAEGGLAPNSKVEFSGGGQVTTDATGRATFAAPDQPGVIFATLVGKEVTVSATVVRASPGAAAVQLTDVPREIALNDRFFVAGTGFRGEAGANRALLGRKKALILAASPVSLVILPDPQTPPGPAQLLVESRGAQASTQVTLLALDIEGGAPNAAAGSAVAPGQERTLTVRVRGTGLPVELEAHNLTPEVVKLMGGDLQRITTSGGPDNTAALKLKGSRAGDYSISVRLVPAAAGLPDMETARQDLLAAQRVAPAHLRGQVDKLIEQLSRHPDDYLKVRDKLEKMLAERPEGEFGRWLEAAWRVLLNR